MSVRPLAAAMLLALMLPVSAAWAAPEARAVFQTNEGADAGEAVLREGPTGVLLRIEVEGLAPGWHGVHFHATGDCSDEKFMASGGHINHAHEADKAPHGLLNPDGPDFGDLPNLYVAADGAGKAEMFSGLVSFDGAGDRAALFDADGSAIVIHESADDHASQPIGGAGARIACAVLERTE
ncbi:superoxide dismutase family protein [Parvibaculum sp.]|uniref:superoxide dismutase family protein n=1 Tax=Parvibaculum sp. TaxID=2024848 RepID=UPI001DCD0835|nr:superoxide dismutase family protein [Parvibaculum sp.]MBX3489951.1 superoxide dismutase family protein [Parvibaculum sp.]MCW5726061.1 superoxide dismutase family protein [Parvibaculum sp.]